MTDDETQPAPDDEGMPTEGEMRGQSDGEGDLPHSDDGGMATESGWDH